MTFGEFMLLVEEEAQGNDSGRAWKPGNVKLALRWALKELVVRAASASTSRMLFSGKLDLVNDADGSRTDKGEYRLPVNVLSIKSVWDSSTDPPIPYQRISHHARDMVESDGAYLHAGSEHPYVYWQTHRTLHLRPYPGSDTVAALRYYAYAVPHIPRAKDEELVVPPEAEDWIITRTCLKLIPKPRRDVLEVLTQVFADQDQELRRWLRSPSSDLPLNPTPESVLV